ncbi:hypothetical protein HDU87_008035 [Geranomyces variabilis]|uniref:Uncharacterized protein n=1 Tax=Geranomyces variabilis TaxID=109894 RepID=A0AAD5TR92_9FUNG|nr:hypothetical protein HDU87_008035 [Geranomyces variabilis]
MELASSYYDSSSPYEQFNPTGPPPLISDEDIVAQARMAARNRQRAAQAVQQNALNRNYQTYLPSVGKGTSEPISVVPLNAQASGGNNGVQDSRGISNCRRSDATTPRKLDHADQMAMMHHQHDPFAHQMYQMPSYAAAAYQQPAPPAYFFAIAPQYLVPAPAADDPYIPDMGPASRDQMAVDHRTSSAMLSRQSSAPYMLGPTQYAATSGSLIPQQQQQQQMVDVVPKEAVTPVIERINLVIDGIQINESEASWQITAHVPQFAKNDIVVLTIEDPTMYAAASANPMSPSPASSSASDGSNSNNTQAPPIIPILDANRGDPVWNVAIYIEALRITTWTDLYGIARKRIFNATATIPLGPKAVKFGHVDTGEVIDGFMRIHIMKASLME